MKCLPAVKVQVAKKATMNKLTIFRNWCKRQEERKSKSAELRNRRGKS
jgi:hypothetical protein